MNLAVWIAIVAAVLCAAIAIYFGIKRKNQNLRLNLF